MSRGSSSRAPGVRLSPASARWVRVAIVEDGAIVAERCVPPERAITWGTSEGCDFALPGAPEGCRALVRPTREGPEVPLDGEMFGRVRDARDDVDVRRLALRGALAVPLGVEARARITRGALTVLITRSEPPAQRARPHLPLGVRGGLFGEADARFSAIVAASLVLHGVLVTVLSEMDLPAAQSLDEYTATMIYDEPLLPPDDLVDAVDPAPLPPDDSAPELHADARDTPSTPDPGRPAPREHRASRTDAGDADPSLRDDVRAAVDQAEQLLIGATSAEGGAFGDLLARGAPTASQEDIFADVEGVSVASRSDMMRERGPRVPGEITRDLGSLDVHAGPLGPRGPGPVDERRITTHVPADEIVCEYPGTDFDTRDLVRAIRGRMGAVRACYEHELVRDPSLRGRFDLEVTLQPVGTLSSVRVVDDQLGSAAVSACAERAMRSVRVTRPPSEAVTASFPIVFESQ